MKHASPKTILKLSGLLDQIRLVPALVEKKPGVYYKKSKAFLHFHEDGDLIFADVRLTGPDFDRLPSTTQNEHANLLRAIQLSCQ